MASSEKLIMSEAYLIVAEKYAREDDTDINESLVHALESKNTTDRRIAVKALIELNDLYAASEVYWIAENGSQSARLAAVEILGALCTDTMTLQTLIKISKKDKNSEVRGAAIKSLRKFDDIFDTSTS